MLSGGCCQQIVDKHVEFWEEISQSVNDWQKVQVVMKLWAYLVGLLHQRLWGRQQEKQSNFLV